MENKFILSEEEKNRILNLHKTATQKQYLSEQNNASDVRNYDPKLNVINIFPGCIYNDPRTINNSGERTNGDYYAIKGNGQFDGLYFYNNYRYKDKDGTMKSYSCDSSNMISLTPSQSTTPKQPVKLQTTVNSLDDVLKGQYLHLGSKGNAVKELQIKLGINPPTEYFGKITFDKVKNFQTKNGLNPDGIVGPKTYQTLKDQDFKTAQNINRTLGGGGLPDYSGQKPTNTSQPTSQINPKTGTDNVTAAMQKLKQPTK